MATKKPPSLVKYRFRKMKVGEFETLPAQSVNELALLITRIKSARYYYRKNFGIELTYVTTDKPLSIVVTVSSTKQSRKAPVVGTFNIDHASIAVSAPTDGRSFLFRQIFLALLVMNAPADALRMAAQAEELYNGP